MTIIYIVLLSVILRFSWTCTVTGTHCYYFVDHVCCFCLPVCLKTAGHRRTPQDALVTTADTQITNF